ncbi:MAG: hypothetical protein AB1420_15805 [Bacillota bacterium]
MQEESCTACEILKRACKKVDETGMCEEIIEKFKKGEITEREMNDLLEKKFDVEKLGKAIDEANIEVAKEKGYTDEEIKKMLKEMEG